MVNVPSLRILKQFRNNIQSQPYTQVSIVCMAHHVPSTILTGMVLWQKYFYLQKATQFITILLILELTELVEGVCLGCKGLKCDCKVVWLEGTRFALHCIPSRAVVLDAPAALPAPRTLVMHFFLETSWESC